jgi:hypothetical protein
MPGRYGLLLVIFALMVRLARWLDFGGLREIDAAWFQIINLMFCFGLSVCIVGLLGRYWTAVKQSG